MHKRPLLCQFIDDVRDVPVIEPLDFKFFLTEKLKALSPCENYSDSRVLILSRRLDLEADLVGRGLLRRGIDYLRLNNEDIPSQVGMTYLFTQDCDLKAELTIRQQTVKNSKISAVWLRDFDVRAIDFGKSELISTFSFQQWDDAFRSLQNNLTCEWISSAQATLNASDRIGQLSNAKSLGFDIPASLVTNDPNAARNFYDTYQGNVVLKVLHHHGIEVDGKLYSMYTHKLEDSDLSRFDDLSLAPCILQQRLDKQSELRVTVVGERVFAVEIDSQSNTKARDDMHRGPLANLPKNVVKLDNSTSERCIRLIKSLGLRYGAIDFVIERNGAITFLEVNPTGDWYWVEHETQLPITEAMVDFLEEFTRNS